MKKRIVSIVLVCVMIIGVLSVTVFAHNGQELPIVNPQATIKGVSLVLSGEIGLVFHFYVPSKYDDGYVELYTLDSDNNKRTEKTDISVCKQKNNLDSEHLPTVTFHLNALELSKEVHIVVYDKYGKQLSNDVEFSAEKYIKEILDSGNTEASNREKEVARTLLNYGHYAQLACSDANGWEIGEEYPETNAYNDLKENSSVFNKDKYEIKWSTLGGQFNKFFIALDLDYKTAIHIFVQLNEPPVDVKVNDVEWGIEKSDVAKGTYEIVIDGINVLNLTDGYKITVDDVEIKLCALSYCKYAIEHNASDNTANAMIALYEFYRATYDYFYAKAEV